MLRRSLSAEKPSRSTVERGGDYCLDLPCAPLGEYWRTSPSIPHDGSRARHTQNRHGLVLAQAAKRRKRTSGAANANELPG